MDYSLRSWSHRRELQIKQINPGFARFLFYSKPSASKGIIAPPSFRRREWGRGDEFISRDYSLRSWSHRGELQIKQINPGFARFLFYSKPHTGKPGSVFHKIKIPSLVAKGLICLIWRRKRDSNPRSRGYRTTVFKTAAFDRSAISPPQR